MRGAEPATPGLRDARQQGAVEVVLFCAPIRHRHAQIYIVLQDDLLIVLAAGACQKRTIPSFYCKKLSKALSVSQSMLPVAFLLISLAAVGEAFTASSSSSSSTSRPVLVATSSSCSGRHTRRSKVSSRQLHMAPRWDGTKWIPTLPEDGPEAGYPPTKTLLLHGPKPYLTRVFQPDDYEQAVLKFMASDKVSRIEAQGNMDAYLRNPNDWQFNRMEEQKRGVKYDYWTLEPSDVVKTVLWSAIVIAFAGRAAYSLATGVYFYDFGPFGGNQ